MSLMNSIHLSISNGLSAPMTTPAISAKSAVWFKARFFVHPSLPLEELEELEDLLQLLDKSVSMRSAAFAIVAGPPAAGHSVCQHEQDMCSLRIYALQDILRVSSPLFRTSVVLGLIDLWATVQVLQSGYQVQSNMERSE